MRQVEIHRQLAKFEGSFGVGGRATENRNQVATPPGDALYPTVDGIRDLCSRAEQSHSETDPCAELSTVPELPACPGLAGALHQLVAQTGLNVGVVVASR